jgi:hypothetical protein
MGSGRWGGRARDGGPGSGPRPGGGSGEQLEFPGTGQLAGRHGVQYQSKKGGGTKTEWYVTPQEAERVKSIMSSQGHKGITSVKR